MLSPKHFIKKFHVLLEFLAKEGRQFTDLLTVHVVYCLQFGFLVEARTMFHNMTLDVRPALKPQGILLDHWSCLIKNSVGFDLATDGSIKLSETANPKIFNDTVFR